MCDVVNGYTGIGAKPWKKKQTILHVHNNNNNCNNNNNIIIMVMVMVMVIKIPYICLLAFHTFHRRSLTFDNIIINVIMLSA